MLLILQNNILLQQKTTILAKKTMFSFLLICFSILSINKLVESSPISNNVYLKTPQLSVSLQELEDSKMHPDISNNSNGDLEAVQNKHTKEYDAEYWRTLSHQFIDNQLKNKLNTEKAKNVILFLGDGMGLTTLAAARFLLGGAEQQLSFEKFPYVGLAKTYSVDKIVPDSACTATAYLCGVKAMEGTIGVNGKVDMSDCESGVDEKNHVHSIAKWALDKGKSAGLVTTTRVTHASPAGVYAHVADRVWENDNAVKEACNPTQSQLIKDIAFQLINGEVGQKLKVILGGGLENFVDKSKYDKGKRTDGLNLIETFKNENLRNVYVRTRNELLNVNPKTTERLLGLFQDSHLLYHLETLNTTTNIDQPTLEEMTRKAIEHLQENDKGYFLFVEGGRIDIAHHSNMARLALDETIEFSKAINTARAMTKESDTLIVVTADHSHSFSFAGYGVNIILIIK